MKTFNNLRFYNILVVASLIIASIIPLSIYANEVEPNEIKLGTASLKIKFHGDVPPAEKMWIFIGWNELLGDPIDMPDQDLFDSGDGTYRIDLPVQTSKTTALLKIADNIGYAYALGFVDLIQGDTLTLNGTFIGDSLTIEPSNPAGFNSYPMDNSEQRNVAAFVNQEFMDIISYNPENPVIIHGITDPQKVYAAGDSAWREVLRQNDEVYLPIINKERTKELLHGKQLQTFLKNLSTFIYGVEYLRYDKIRSNWAPEGNRDMPPLEYYDFLNRIDFSNLTDFLPYYPPFHILKNILLYFPIKIEPIGNTPVDQWQAQAKEKLGQVITNVPDNMVRLLSAASYRMQLDDNKPFTPAQIRNISAGYSGDDLGQILLNANSKLEAQLKDRLKIHDLTAETAFDLKSFIDANYPGRPVVVDFWNTWCSPCLRAHKETESLRKQPEADGIVFLYVSDTSSDNDTFDQLAPRIGGEHLRLSSQTADNYVESQGFNGIPCYFFFDRDHNLVHKQLSFPGADKYLNLLRQL